MEKLCYLLVDGYKILSAKYITKGAGLDPLRAQKLDKAFKPEASGIADNPRMVSVGSLARVR